MLALPSGMEGGLIAGTQRGRSEFFPLPTGTHPSSLHGLKPLLPSGPPPTASPLGGSLLPPLGTDCAPPGQSESLSSIPRTWPGRARGRCAKVRQGRQDGRRGAREQLPVPGLVTILLYLAPALSDPVCLLRAGPPWDAASASQAHGSPRGAFQGQEGPYRPRVTLGSSCHPDLGAQRPSALSPLTLPGAVPWFSHLGNTGSEPQGL